MTKPSVCARCGWFATLENGVLKCGCWPLKCPMIEEDSSPIPPTWPDENMDAAIKWNINAALNKSSSNSLALYARDLLCRIRELEENRKQLLDTILQIEQAGHNPADLAPDLIGLPNRYEQLVLRLAGFAHEALVRNS